MSLQLYRVTVRVILNRGQDDESRELRDWFVIESGESYAIMEWINDTGHDFDQVNAELVCDVGEIRIASDTGSFTCIDNT